MKTESWEEFEARIAANRQRLLATASNDAERSWISLMDEAYATSKRMYEAQQNISYDQAYLRALNAATEIALANTEAAHG